MRPPLSPRISRVFYVLHLRHKQGAHQSLCRYRDCSGLEVQLMLFMHDEIIVVRSGLCRSRAAAARCLSQHINWRRSSHFFKVLVHVFKLRVFALPCALVCEQY